MRTAGSRRPPQTDVLLAEARQAFDHRLHRLLGLQIMVGKKVTKGCVIPQADAEGNYYAAGSDYRLLAGLIDQYTRAEEWNQRDLSGKQYVYFWVDGVYPQARMEDPNPCLLTIIGADASGRKELVSVWDGFRESEQSWLELLLDLKRRGLAMAPKVAVGDGAMGFWKALMQVYPSTRHQRCWVHKIANVLNKFPKSMQPTVKADLREIWQAETRAKAKAAMDIFAEKYGIKYDNALSMFCSEMRQFKSRSSMTCICE